MRGRGACRGRSGRGRPGQRPHPARTPGPATLVGGASEGRFRRPVRLAPFYTSAVLVRLSNGLGVRGEPADGSRVGEAPEPAFGPLHAPWPPDCRSRNTGLHGSSVPSSPGGPSKTLGWGGGLTRGGGPPPRPPAPGPGKGRRRVPGGLMTPLQLRQPLREVPVGRRDSALTAGEATAQAQRAEAAQVLFPVGAAILKRGRQRARRARVLEVLCGGGGAAGPEPGAAAPGRAAAAGRQGRACSGGGRGGSMGGERVRAAGGRSEPPGRVDDGAADPVLLAQVQGLG